MKLTDFKNKIVYLVGGSTGIGLSMAKLLSQNGANIMLFARRKKPLVLALNALKHLQKNENQKFDYTCLDITDPALTSSVMSDLATSFGIPDLLINCAGRAIPRKFEEVDYEQFEQTLKTNLFGCRNTIASLLPYMKIKGGTIVNVSSIAGVIGVFGYTDYCASKFALIGFSEALRSELKAFNIKVSVLCPPDTETPGYQNENLTKPPETKAISQSANLLSADQVAKTFFKELPKNKMLIIPGIEGKFSVLMKRLFPVIVEFAMDRQIAGINK